MEVYPLWHVHHAPTDDGSPVTHREEIGHLVWDEQEGDDLKLLGVYSTQALADERIGRARDSLGFRDEPDCFDVARYVVNQDQWDEGFVTI